MTAYKKATTIAPMSLEPKRKLAEISLRQNALDEAEGYIADILKTNKDDTAGHYLKGRLSLVRDQLSEAITALKKVTKEEPIWLRPVPILVSLISATTTRNWPSRPLLRPSSWPLT